MAFSSQVFETSSSGQDQQQSLQQQQQEEGYSSPAVKGCVQQAFGLGYFLPGSNSVVVPIQECSIAVSGQRLGYLLHLGSVVVCTVRYQAGV
jgi:hypothetical protein